MIQAVIFDIDNTLYDYDAAHAVAFQALTEYAQHTLGVDPETFEALHQRANQLLQVRTGGDCAAIHNRLLRYQILLEELSQIFDVSPMTIRRDLQHLEDQGLISRFYGGAVAEQPVSPAGDADQVKLYRDLISQYAANLVAENDQIFINGSRTALGLLDFLGGQECPGVHQQRPGLRSEVSLQPAHYPVRRRSAGPERHSHRGLHHAQPAHGTRPEGVYRLHGHLPQWRTAVRHSHRAGHQ